MLPLWIIDITKKSERRDAFLRLVGQIEHVFVANKPVHADANTDMSSYGDHRDCVDCDTESLESELLEGILCSEHKKNVEEKVLSDEEREAIRNARIDGNYWYYSNYELESFFNPIELSAKDIDLKDTADRLYDFQEAVVSDAKQFISMLRESNSKPCQPINVVVLGDASEELTQLVFSSVAVILQKEKGRFLTGHIHQGMSVIGMLYVPCNANALEVGKRERILRLFREIEVQYNIATIRGYDNMMLYQDVQNRTECTYKKLSDGELAEYLVQCLVHLYLACDINHPLLSGTGSDDVFYFSMGATSVYFDMTVEDKSDINLVAANIVNIFKEDGDHAKSDIEIDLFDKENLPSSSKFVEQFNFEQINLDVDGEMRKPRPHPVKDWLHHHLKRLYYQHYLRFYPAELLRSIMQKIEEETNYSLETISIKCSSAFSNVAIALPAAITRIISKVNAHGGGLSFVESKFREMEEYISKQKSTIQQSIQGCYWLEIIEKLNDSSFENYHDAYISDIKVKNSGAGCNAMKQEALSKLRALLSKEKTMSATLARSIFLGIMCVIVAIPVLDFLSPDTLNLGDVREYSVLWSLLIFAIPFLIQLVSYWWYQRKKKRLIHTLKIYYTHDAYARIANRVESEAVSYYNKVLALVEEYLQRCRDIRNEVNIITPDPNIKLLFPQSMFNQPLNGGAFDGEPLISTADVERCRIKVNNKQQLVNFLSRDQYFVLINRFKDGFARLFDGVSVAESHTRRFDESVGDYVFVGRDEILKQKALRWMDIKDRFSKELLGYIKDCMCPRLYPTIGEKLKQHSAKIDRYNTLKYMIAMAATNGEFASESDTEYADVKVNKDINVHVMPYLPIYTTNTQYSEYDELFKKYLFITRWRTYKRLSFNRLLPKEDFDTEMREERIFVFEEDAKRRKRREYSLKKQGVDIIDGSTDARSMQQGKNVEEKDYERIISSLFLWSVCPDDNSNEWLKLFEVEHFNVAYKERLAFREIMNKND